MAKIHIDNGESGLSVRNKINSMFGELYNSTNVNNELVLSVIRIPAGETNYIAKINKLFFDYGRGSEPQAKHSADHYNEIYFDIINGGNTILDKGTFAHYDNLITYLNALTNVGIIIKAYFIIGYPEFNNIYPKNQSYNFLKGGGNNYKKRITTVNSNWSELFADVAANYYYPFLNTPLVNADSHKAVWLTQPGRNTYTGFKQYSKVSYFGEKIYAKDRMVWDDANAEYVNLSNLFNAIYTKQRGSTIETRVTAEIFNTTGSYNLLGLWIEYDIYVNKESLMNFYLIKFEYQGGDYYSLIAKPVAQDIFLLPYLENVSNYNIYAYFEGGLRKPYVRKLDITAIDNEDYNISWAVLKSDIIRYAITSNDKKRQSNPNSHIYSNIRFFYQNKTTKEVSRLSKSINVVTRRRGYSLGLMLNGQNI